MVVRRRCDGVAELRIPTGGAEAGAVLLDVVRDQLDTLAPDEFRAAWGLVDVPPEPLSPENGQT